MEPWVLQILYIVVGLVFLVGLSAVGYQLWTEWQTRPGDEQPRQPTRPRQQSDDNIIEMVISEDGEGHRVAQSETMPTHSSTPRRADRAPQAAEPPPEPVVVEPTEDPGPTGPRFAIFQSIFNPLYVIGGIVLLVLGFGIFYWYQGYQQMQYANSFVVLVAPFNNSGDPQTGVAVARETVDILQTASADQLVVEQIEQAPANAEEALAIVRERQADVLIWGDVQTGGSAYRDQLQPRLTYAPGGAYAPVAWMGYQGRFTGDRTYTLSAAPNINGEAVLPRLLLALEDYSMGQFEAAIAEMQQLRADYPQLNPTLLQVLNGNALWATGQYEEAASEYRRTLAQVDSERGVLQNNLGAILVDLRDTTAEGVLTEAAQQINSADLPAVHYNLGLLKLYAGRTPEAIDQFEHARTLLPDDAPAPLLFALSQAYRDTGQLPSALETLEQAEQQVGRELDQVPDNLRSSLDHYLYATAQEQRGLLELARLVNARGPLTWELEVAAAQTAEELQAVNDHLRNAVQATSELEQEWQAQALTNIAASNQSGSVQATPWSVADGQQQMALTIRERQQYHLGLGLIEQGRTPGGQERGVFEEFRDRVFGTAPPLVEAQRLLEAQEQTFPVRLALARLLRVQDTSNDDMSEEEKLATLDTRYAQIIASAPDQPEGYHGRGQVALLRSDRAAASQLMQDAIARNERFFPARIELAQLAEEDNNWTAALDQRRTVVQHYPVAISALELATTLRQSGNTRLAEAEEILVALTASEQVSADIRQSAYLELGQLRVAQNQPELAMQAFEEAQALNGGSADAALEMGRVLVQIGNQGEETESYQRAEDQFYRAIDHGSEQVRTQAHLELAHLYSEQFDQTADANQHYELAIEGDIRDAVTLIQVGDQLMDYGNIAGASTAYLRASEMQPDNPELQHRLAQTHLALNDFDSARRHAGRVLELTTASDNPVLRASALSSLGDVERQTGNLDAAVNQYNEALALDANQIDAVIGLGTISVARNNWGLAQTQFQRAVNMPAGQDNALAHFWYAEALMRNNSLQAALNHYDQALALRSYFPEALLGKAQTQYQLSEPAAASETIAQAIEQNPDYAEGLIFQGEMLYEQDEVDAAMTAFNRAVDINDQLDEAFYRRGLIYLEQQDYRQAVSDLQRATELRPDYGTYFYWLGQAHMARDQITEARRAFQTAVEQAATTDTAIVERAQNELERIEQEFFAQEGA